MAYSDYTDNKTALLNASVIAAIPLMTESIGLMVDAVKELRAQMDRNRVTQQELAPLERKLKTAEMQHAIAELDALREGLVEDRKVSALERQVQMETAKQELSRLKTIDCQVGGEVKIPGFDYDA